MISLNKNFDENYSVAIRNAITEKHDTLVGSLNTLYEIWQTKQIYLEIKYSPNKKILDDIIYILYNYESLISIEEIYEKYFSFITWSSFNSVINEGNRYGIIAFNFTQSNKKMIKLFEPFGYLYYEIYEDVI